VVWTAPAQKDLRRLDRQIAGRARTAVRRFADTQHEDVQKREGSEDRYRLRAGDYRVIFRSEDGRIVIVVLHVRQRSDAYRDCNDQRQPAFPE